MIGSLVSSCKKRVRLHPGTSSYVLSNPLSGILHIVSSSTLQCDVLAMLLFVQTICCADSVGVLEHHLYGVKGGNRCGMAVD